MQFDIHINHTSDKVIVLSIVGHNLSCNPELTKRESLIESIKYKFNEDMIQVLHPTYECNVANEAQ